MASMLRLASVPWYDGNTLGSVLSTLEQVMQQVPAYDLHFTPDERAADCIVNFISK